MENIVPACVDCNQMKAWRTEAEFIRDRPALLQRRTLDRGVPPRPLRTPTWEEKNEPGLLQKLVREREHSPSLWWRSA